MVRLHITPHLGEKRLDRLTVADCQRFANGRLADGHTATTVHTMVATLATALNRAMREEVISRNVAALVTLEVYTASGDEAHRSALDRVSEALRQPPKRPPPSPGISR